MGPEVQTTTTMTSSDHGSSSDHGAHAAPAHDAAHGHDDHGHAADTLGPIAWKMWAAGLIGVLAALAVLIGVVLATRFSFTA
jgi:hypothetical protein